MTAVFRVIMMLVGYIWACIAASAVLTFGTLAPNWDDLDALGRSLGNTSGDVPTVALWSVIGIGAVIIFAIGFFPTLLAVVLTEGLKLRSIIVHALIGCALALAAVYGLDFGGYVTAPNADMMHEREVFAAAGIAGGLVYWLFAGRRAGAWK
ncbi:MAG TPA: hypothetical protein VK825_20150 [Xanthobacteraceae bacterium]|jgi:hypothetical protein|nr:hypothetical protein [Xanthobacteraceae bacterium]